MVTLCPLRILADYAHHITDANLPKNFFDVPTALLYTLWNILHIFLLFWTLLTNIVNFLLNIACNHGLNSRIFSQRIFFQTVLKHFRKYQICLGRLLDLTKSYSNSSSFILARESNSITGTPPITLFFETLKNCVSRKPCC